jgi:hypothetical protein
MDGISLSVFYEFNKKYYPTHWTYYLEEAMKHTDKQEVIRNKYNFAYYIGFAIELKNKIEIPKCEYDDSLDSEWWQEVNKKLWKWNKDEYSSYARI